MLVLTRKTSQQIQIGDEVVITILHVKGQSVRIGIEAPRNVKVLRAELPKSETPDEPTAAAACTDPPIRPAIARPTKMPGVARAPLATRMAGQHPTSLMSMPAASLQLTLAHAAS
jgi:carbon storage regulator CsrA